MEIVNDILKSKKVDKPEVEQVQKQKQEYKLIGTFLRTKGLKLFHYSPITFELNESIIKYSDTIHVIPDNGVLTTVDKEVQKCNVDTRAIYFEALNIKNARKRFEKWQRGEITELCNLREPSKEGIKFF